MKRTTALVTVALSWSLAQSAAAESRSWKAVKGSVNGSATIVVGANLEPIRQTATYATALTMFLDEHEDAKQAFDMIKSTCQIDVPTAVADVTAVMKADEKPLVVLGLNGLDEAKVVACLEKIVHQMSGGKTTVTFTAKKAGKITEYSVAGETKKLYVAWLAADVLAFTDDVNDKAKLAAMLKGKAPKGALGAMLGKLSTAAPVWFAATMKEKEAGIGTVTGVYGTAEISGGVISATGHAVMAKPAEATAALNAGTAALAEAKTKAGKIPAAAKLIESIKLVAAGKEVTATGSIADKDILGMIPELEAIF